MVPRTVNQKLCALIGIVETNDRVRSMIRILSENVSISQFSGRFRYIIRKFKGILNL